MDLVPCESCGSMRVVGGCTCPHCGASKCARTSNAAVAAALLLGLTVAVGPTGCGNEPPYGLSVIDEDQDGYTVDDDCDDSDPDVNPEATETPGDSVDSNCDGEDDT